MPPARLAASDNLPYVAPFVAFLVLLAMGPLLPAWLDGPFRAVVLCLVLWFFSRRVIRIKAALIIPSACVGVLVFLIWIGPDSLVPGYRDHWLFQNAVMGTVKASIPLSSLNDPWVLTFRVLRSVVLVPIVEELFWRSWLMRWLISREFERVPMGSYSATSFWITAALFSLEHGPFWDVGLMAGIAYNWWMTRARTLGDCILAHAVTNASLAGYVIATHRWEYWL